MRRPQEIAKEQQTMAMITGLTSIFEGLASMRIARIKNSVLQAQDFFKELWHIYKQIRVDSQFRYGRSQSDSEVIDKELLIVITAEGGFSGDIDQKLISWMLKNYHKEQQDIVVIGHHGAVQLAQAGVTFKKYYKLPESDTNINVAPLIKEVQKYKSCTVYYQTYVSLMVQDVKRINLSQSVQQQGQTVEARDEIISEENYIFEPSTFAVVDHLERSMLNIALSQVILDSKLAQYASRFRAMSAAHDRATESSTDLKLDYNRAKRAVKDERLKEIVNGLKKARA
jgi:F-type H+-transporting ATPase subunit gamma